MAEKFKIKKGDKVIVTAGKDKGQTGEVVRVDRSDRRVVVSGVNMIKRHQKPSQGNPGGIIEREAAIAISNVAIQDPKDGKATRVGFRTLEDGRKVRFAVRSGEQIDV